MEEKAKVYLVGAGPGDPELMTLKGMRLIESCDALVYDYLISEEYLKWVKADCELYYVGKRKGFHSLEQEKIEALLIELWRAGKSVVRLKGGDPFIFGRGGEEALSLRAAGIGYEVVPAVTAALGCAAYSGIPLTHRNISTAVTFISGHECPDKETATVDWEKYGSRDGTLVIYMGMGHLRDIANSLIRGGKKAETPVAVVEWGTTPKQRNLTATLVEIADKVEECGMGAPAVVIVGEVARLGAQLGWR